MDSRVAVRNSLAGLEQGLAALKEWLGCAKVTQQAEDRALLVFEEIVTNIIRYAFADSAEHPILVSFALGHGEVALTFEDDGRPFDPRTAPPPDLDRSLMDASIGGRGIFLVRQMAKRLD